MKTTLSTSQAAHLLIDDSNAGWSRSGAFALVEHLEEMESDTGEEFEFCPVSIRCAYGEYSSLQDWVQDYHGVSTVISALESCGVDLDGDEDENEVDDLIRSHIQDHGELIEFGGGIIVSSF